MPVIDPVAEGRRLRAEQATAAAEAPPVTEPPAPEPEPAPPTFVEGEHVSSTDPRRPAGTVAGPPEMAQCYTITPDDGSEPYMAAESELEPYTETPPEEEPPMTDETIAPAGLARAAGLSDGATMGEVTAAVAARDAELERERAEARDAALTSAGMKGDLMPHLAASITRAEGQTWADAVAVFKASTPSAFHAETAPAETAETAEPGSTPLGTAGAAVPPVRTPAAQAAQKTGRATGTDAISAHRARLNQQYDRR